MVSCHRQDSSGYGWLKHTRVVSPCLFFVRTNWRFSVGLGEVQVDTHSCFYLNLTSYLLNYVQMPIRVAVLRVDVLVFAE